MLARTFISRARNLLIFPVAGLVLAFGPARLDAGVPVMMNYQGYLTDLDNAPRHGTFGMDFAIFADSVGGSPLWSESYGSVSVEAGIFNVLLGSVNPLPAVIFSGPRLWLETTVADTTLAPRRPLVTVPYSFHAQRADTAQVIGRTYSVLKTLDQPVTLNQNDNELFLPLLTNEVWEFECWVYVGGSGSFQYGPNIPTGGGATVSHVSSQHCHNSTSVTNGFTEVDTNVITLSTMTLCGSQKATLRIRGVVVNVGPAVNLNFKWALVSGNPVIKANSFLKASKLN
jgi:hypothetical protein